MGKPLPDWAIAVWERDFEQIGANTDYSMHVRYLQANILFSDCRVRVDRPPSLRNATSIDDYGMDELAHLAQSHGFAGGTTFKAARLTGDALINGTWLGNLTWHHAITDYQNTCVDSSSAWPAFLNGSDVSDDVGGIELMSSIPPVLHEHAYPINQPVTQYEQWRSLSMLEEPQFGLVWPTGHSHPPAALLVVLGSYFVFARDRPIFGPAPGAYGNCSIFSVLQSSELTLPEKRQYFDAELSFGRVEGVSESMPRLIIEQSTLPFREGKALSGAELCRPGWQEFSEPKDPASETLLSAILGQCDIFV